MQPETPAKIISIHPEAIAVGMMLLKILPCRSCKPYIKLMKILLGIPTSVNNLKCRLPARRFIALREVSTAIKLKPQEGWTYEIGLAISFAIKALILFVIFHENEYGSVVGVHHRYEM